MKNALVMMVSLFLWGNGAVWAQNKKVTGIVLDETGHGLPGAQVLVKGTEAAALTEDDGRFAIDYTGGVGILIVQLLGYTKQELPMGSAALSIRMRPSSTMLKETVVTALGISKEKRSLGYTQSSVSSETIEKSGEQNVIEALAAKSAGILVTGSGGTPGSSAQILIRGNSNINGGVSQPLFVVDGIPLDNGTSQPAAGDYPYDQNLSGVNESNRGIDINPNDIESVSILRGPAAAALYGVSGGNGAIIITTKRGKFGNGKKKLNVDYSSNIELSTVNKMPALQNAYLQGAKGLFSTTSNQSWGAKADTTNIPTYDKYKDFFKMGASYVNNLALSWGADNSSYRIGIGNTKTDGVVPNAQFNRTTVNFRADTKISEKLSIGGDFNYTNAAGVRVQNGSNVGGIMLTLLRAPINYDVKDYIDPLGNQTQYWSAYDNPLFSAYRNTYSDITNRVFGNINASAQLAEGLTLSERLGIDVYSTNTKQIYDLSSVANDNADGSGQINLSNAARFYVYNDLILRYNKNLSEDISFSALLGYNYTYESNQSSFARGRNIQIPGIYELSNTNTLYASNLENYFRTKALFGEGTMAYKSLLYLTITTRNEWLSSYGRNGKSFLYPKADMAFVFSDLLPKSRWMTYGKVRAAYADGGNGPGGYLTNTFVQPFITDGSTNGVGFPYKGNQGYGPSNVFIDQNIRPSHTQGKEIGLETKLFANRVAIEFTYYNQVTKDGIISLPIAPSTGYSAFYTNGGTSQNKGIEVALSVDIVKAKDFSWNVFGNFTRDRSKVLSLNPQISSVAVGSGFDAIGSYSLVGQAIGVFYGTAWERDAATGKILVDANGQAILSPNAKVIGNPNPDWTMGLGSSFRYKNFGCSFLWDIRKGGDIWNGTWARLNRLGLTDESADRNKAYLIDGIYAPNTANAGQENKTTVSAEYYYQTFKGDGGKYAAENAVQDASWIRLRSVNLSYRLNFQHTSKHSLFNYIEIGFTAKNLLLFTKYKGVDPETSLTGASSAFRGYDYFNNPGVKSYLVTLKVSL